MGCGGRAGREEKRPLAAPQGEQKGREPVAATRQGLRWSGAETDESEDSGTMGSAGSARPGTRRDRDRDVPGWGSKLPALHHPEQTFLRGRRGTEGEKRRGFFCLERKETGELMERALPRVLLATGPSCTSHWRWQGTRDHIPAPLLPQGTPASLLPTAACSLPQPCPLYKFPFFINPQKADPGEQEE